MNKKENLKKECIAFILMPAYHKGPRQNIVDILYNNGPENEGNRYLTHSLHYPSTDPVLLKISDNNLNNDQKSKVKIIFVPCYLNGNDGIFIFRILIFYGFAFRFFRHIMNHGLHSA